MSKKKLMNIRMMMINNILCTLKSSKETISSPYAQKIEPCEVTNLLISMIWVTISQAINEQNIM